MTAPGFDTAAIRERWPIRKWLESRGVEIRNGGTGMFRCRCPVHRGENPNAFSFSPLNEHWFCHRCNAGGDVIRLTELADGVAFEEACRILGAERERSGGTKLNHRPAARPATTEPPPLAVRLPALDRAQLREMENAWSRLAYDEALIEQLAASREWEDSTLSALACPTSTQAWGQLGWMESTSSETGWIVFLFPHAMKRRQLFRDPGAPGGWRWHLPDGGKVTRWHWPGWPWNGRELWREDRLKTSPIARTSCLILEGEPDAISAVDDFQETTWQAVLAIPSATIGRDLRARMPAVLEGLDVIYAADNDDAGQRAKVEMARLMSGRAKSIRALGTLQIP